MERVKSCMDLAMMSGKASPEKSTVDPFGSISSEDQPAEDPAELLGQSLINIPDPNGPVSTSTEGDSPSSSQMSQVDVKEIIYHDAGETDDGSEVTLVPPHAYVEVEQQLETNSPLGRQPRELNNTLYVADLEKTDANGEVLYNLFSPYGSVMSVKICYKESYTGDLALSHAYVNFSTVEEALLAWERVSYTKLNGIPLRLMFSNLDPTSRYDPKANVIVQNLEESIDSEALHHTFAAFGAVLSSKVQLDDSGKSLGYGYIQFEDEEDAKLAINRVNGHVLNDKKVYVGPFIPRSSAGAPNTSLPPLQFHRSAQIMENGIHDEVVSSTRTPSYEGEDETCAGSDETGAMKRLTVSQRKKAKRRARAEELIKAARAVIFDEKVKLYAENLASSSVDTATLHDPNYAPSSEPWAPQPWSVETLLSNLSSARLAEERKAMLGGTLLPLVCHCTSSFTSDVTNELIKLDVADIVRLMKSRKALQAKVEKVKQVIMKKIANQAPYVPPASPPAVATETTPSVNAAASSVDEAVAESSSRAVAESSSKPVWSWTKSGQRRQNLLLCYEKPSKEGTGFF